MAAVFLAAVFLVAVFLVAVFLAGALGGQRVASRSTLRRAAWLGRLGSSHQASKAVVPAPSPTFRPSSQRGSVTRTLRTKLWRGYFSSKPGPSAKRPWDQAAWSEMIPRRSMSSVPAMKVPTCWRWNEASHTGGVSPAIVYRASCSGVRLREG